MPTTDNNAANEDEIRLPVGLKQTESGLEVVLFKVKRTHFREPFFIDSLAKYPFVSKSQIKLPSKNELLVRPIQCDKNDPRVEFEPVKDFLKTHNADELNKGIGFIFHMSRCGSTLATQMLSQSDRFFVLSEPTIINAILDPALEIDISERKALLKASVSALAECSPESSEQMFIKFRSWNILYADIILDVFPEASWLFIHRNGLEILSSVMEKPPGWLRSKDIYAKYFSPILGIDEDEIISMADDEFALRMLGAFCKKAQGLDHGNCEFVDYKDLKREFSDLLLKLWGISLSEVDVKEMSEVSQMHSKDISKTIEFKNDSEIKRAKATEEQQQLSEKFVESERLKLKEIDHEKGREMENGFH